MPHNEEGTKADTGVNTLMSTMCAGATVRIQSSIRSENN